MPSFLGETFGEAAASVASSLLSSISGRNTSSVWVLLSETSTSTWVSVDFIIKWRPRRLTWIPKSTPLFGKFTCTACDSTNVLLGPKSCGNGYDGLSEVDVLAPQFTTSTGAGCSKAEAACSSIPQLGCAVTEAIYYNRKNINSVMVWVSDPLRE